MRFPIILTSSAFITVHHSPSAFIDRHRKKGKYYTKAILILFNIYTLLVFLQSDRIILVNQNGISKKLMMLMPVNSPISPPKLV